MLQFCLHPGREAGQGHSQALGFGQSLAYPDQEAHHGVKEDGNYKASGNSFGRAAVGKTHGKSHARFVTLVKKSQSGCRY